MPKGVLQQKDGAWGDWGCGSRFYPCLGETAQVWGGPGVGSGGWQRRLALLSPDSLMPSPFPTFIGAQNILKRNSCNHLSFTTGKKRWGAKIGTVPPVPHPRPHPHSHKPGALGRLLGPQNRSGPPEALWLPGADGTRGGGGGGKRQEAPSTQSPAESRAQEESVLQCHTHYAPSGRGHRFPPSPSPVRTRVLLPPSQSGEATTPPTLHLKDQL